jgi:uncharacterized protein
MRQVLRYLAVLAFCLSWAFALDLTALKPQGYVSDFAGVVDAGTKAQIERYCARVEQATGAQIALVTIQTLEGEPVEDVANSLFRQWGIGKKGKDEGILLLLVIGDHKSRLEVGYGLEPYIPDGFAGSVLREMRPALRESHYGAALAAAAQVIGSKIAQAKGVEIGQAPQVRRMPQRQRGGGLPWPLIIIGVVVLLALMGRGGSSGGGFLTGMLLGNLLGRGGSGGYGGSGGGFGGYDGDSGGGFGGFGGGDSGGGGASSDW